MEQDQKIILTGDLTAISNVRHSREFRNVRLTWPVVSGAASYLIKRAASSDGPFLQIGETTSLSFDDSTNPPEEKPFYDVEQKPDNKKLTFAVQ